MCDLSLPSSESQHPVHERGWGQQGAGGQGPGHLHLHPGRRGPRPQEGVQEVGHQGGQRGKGN